MKKGDIIRARTNAELLNTILGTRYKQWMKSVYFYDDYSYIWMVKFDDKVRSGWRNRFCNEYIIEEMVDKSVTKWDNFPLWTMDDKKRYVFEKKDGFFKFLGIYQLDPDKSNMRDVSKPRLRFLQCISDTLDIRI